MTRVRPSIVAALAASALALGLAGCSQAGTADTGSSVEVAADTVVVDVRTPAEYAEGHLEGAINVDLESGSFEEQIAELPTDGDYIVYCRSGNRSSQAAAIMAELGFEHVTDAGGIQTATGTTGLAIVTD